MFHGRPSECLVFTLPSGFLAVNMSDVHYLWRGIIVLLLLLASASFPQDVGKGNDYQMKSAYLCDFARMTRWPSSQLPAGSTLRVCVYGGDEGFLDILRATASGKQVNDHRLEIRRVETSREFKSCHLVFVRSSAKDIESALADLASASVLLVGEDKDFLSRGGMVNFLMRDHGARYEFDSGSIARAGLKFDQQASAEPDASNAQPESRPVKVRVDPNYPDMARRMNVIGSVQLQATVRADGTVKEVHVVGGHPLLAEAASRAVMQWHYQPAGRETSERIKIDFGR